MMTYENVSKRELGSRFWRVLAIAGQDRGAVED